MKIIKYLAGSLLITGMTVSAVANSAIISGAYTLPNGNAVNLSGLEWSDLYATQSMSRTYVESQFGSGGMFEGWRVASRTEVSNLLQSLWGGTTEGWSYDNYEGASWFAQNIGDLYPVIDSLSTYTDFFFGSTGSCSSIPYASCRGRYALSVDQGRFDVSWGLQPPEDTSNNPALIDANSVHSTLGTMLVRGSSTASPVPLPGAAWLFGSGLLGLIGASRQRWGQQ